MIFVFLIQVKYFFTIELPDRVSNITFSDTTSASVKISWIDNSLKENPFNYIVDCFGCSKQNIFPVETEKTSVIIKKLNASTIYNISVAVNNSVTVLADKLQYKTAELHTNIGGG